jgi:hypothetical protein
MQDTNSLTHCLVTYGSFLKPCFYPPFAGVGETQNLLNIRK